MLLKKDKPAQIDYLENWPEHYYEIENAKERKEILAQAISRELDLETGLTTTLRETPEGTLKSEAFIDCEGNTLRCRFTSDAPFSGTLSLFREPEKDTTLTFHTTPETIRMDGSIAGGIQFAVQIWAETDGIAAVSEEGKLRIEGATTLSIEGNMATSQADLGKELSHRSGKDFDAAFSSHSKRFSEMMNRLQLTTFCAPPTVYRFLIKEDLSKYDLSSIKYATVAGEALNPEVYQQFLNATGVKLMEGFGQTETTLSVANLVGMTPKPGSMGKPSPLYHVEILNPEGKPVAVGETGEICIRMEPRPAGIMMEYYRDPEKTANAIYDGWYHTGDTAWVDEDGYFWYVGRNDDVIKSSGYRIGPFEIESELLEHEAVRECAVTGVPDPVRGFAVKATVVLADGFTGSDDLTRELQAWVKHRTAPYKYPRIVEYVDALPKTVNASSICCRTWVFISRPTELLVPKKRPFVWLTKSAIRWWFVRAMCSAAAPWISCTTEANSNATCAKPSRFPSILRYFWTASWMTP